MKANKFAYLFTFALVLTVAAVGCKKKPVGVTPLHGQKPIVGEGSTAGLDSGGTAGSGLGAGESVALADPSRFAHMTEDPAALAAYTVYFDFDSSVVKSSEQGKVAAVADTLIQSPSEAVRIAGNCDERGTEGYNLALGERRALALRDALIAAGVNANNIDTISYGEERPVDPNHDEVAWAKNRRGEFILLRP